MIKIEHISSDIHIWHGFQRYLAYQSALDAEDSPGLDVCDNGEPAYSDDMPGMTIEEFQSWTDQLIKDALNGR